jgi:hypothetical protein
MNCPETDEGSPREPVRPRDGEPDEATEGALERLAARLKRLNAQAQTLATFLSRRAQSDP